jgi:hypothetical protein
LSVAASGRHPYYGGVPVEIRDGALELWDEPLRAITKEFAARFPEPRRAS